MVYEMIVEDKNERPKRFKLYSDKYTATITMKINNLQHKMGVKIIRFDVNSNKARTNPLNKMVVHSWQYGTVNWIYVVLSRMRTLKGLFICEKLDYTKKLFSGSKITEGRRMIKNFGREVDEVFESEL